MKINLKVTILLLVMISCTDKNQELLGVWNVESSFYSATYNILEEDGDLKALALYYDDGTTHFKYQEGKTKKMYLFENLKFKNHNYVDAISGATKKANPEQLTLKVLDKDTLSVTTYIMHKPLTEKWIRKNN